MNMFNRLKKIVSDQATKALDYAEVKANPATRGINALASSFALLVMGDRVVETEEMEDVAEYLVDMDVVIEKGLIREVSELFLRQTDFLEAGFKVSVVEGNIRIGEVLRDIALVKDDKEWCEVVADTISLVTSGGSADEGEVKARKRILKALGK